MEIDSFGSGKLTNSTNVEGLVLVNSESYSYEGIRNVLEHANLLQYLPTFIQQGGDDVNQLCDASEEEFNEIVEIVGMSTKPLHVKRLAKAVVAWRTNPLSNPSLVDNSLLASNQEHYSVNNCSLPCIITSVNGGILPVGDDSTPAQASHTIIGEKRSNPGPNCCDITAAKRALKLSIPDDIPSLLNLDKLDIGRLKIIEQSAQIYGKDDTKRRRKLTINEELINEASTQLCLRDPTLLLRRDVLFPLARKVVRESEVRPTMQRMDSDPIDDDNATVHGRDSPDLSLPALIKLPEVAGEVNPIGYSAAVNEETLSYQLINGSDIENEYDVIMCYKIHKCWPRGIHKNKKSHLRRKASRVELIDNKLFYTGINDKRKRAWLTNKDEQRTAIESHHVDKTGKHHGREKTKTFVSSSFFWKGIGTDVAEYIKSCKICVITAEHHRHLTGPLSKIPVITVQHKSDEKAINTHENISITTTDDISNKTVDNNSCGGESQDNVMNNEII